MKPSRSPLARARIAAALVGVLFIGVSVAGVATAAHAAPISTPVFTNPAPGPDPDQQPTIEGDLQVEVANVDVVVTVTNSEGTSTYCVAPNIDTTVTPFFSCVGGILPFGDNAFTAIAFFTGGVPDADPGPQSAPLVYTRYGIGPVSANPPLSPTTEARLDWSGTGPALGTVNVVLEDSSHLCDQVPIGADGTWSCEGFPLTPNIYAIQVEAVDLEGNNPVGTVPFDITIQPPTASIQQTFAAPWLTTGADQVQGTMSEDISQVEVYSSTNPGGPFTTPYCSMPNDIPQLTIYFCNPVDNSGLVAGTNYLATTVTNSAGAQSAFSAPIVMTLVSEPVLAAPSNFSYTNDPTPTLSGTADDAYFTSVSLGHGVEGEFPMCDAVVQPDDTWSCTSVALPDGQYHALGVTSPGTIGTNGTNFTIDTSVPVPPTVDPVSTSDTTPTITGTGEVGAVISIFVDGGFVTCTSPVVEVGEGGTWACALTAPLSVGTHDVSARQVDRAGNVGPIGPQLPILVITPPLSPILPPAATPTPTPTPTPTATPAPLQLLILVWTLGGASGEYAPGDAVTLTGTGLPAGAIANAEIHSTPQQLGTAMVDATGKFQIDAVIPEDIEPGEHTFVITVTAEGAEPSVIEQPVMVVAPEEQKATIPKSEGGDKVFDVPGTDGDGGTVDRNSPSAPSALTTALDTVLDIIGNPVVIVSAAAIGLGLLLFVAIPAELLNATLSEQYGRFARRLPRLKRAPGWWAALTSLLKSTPVVGAILITALVSIIFGFADPAFGFDLTSLRVVLACGIGLLFVGFIANALAGIAVAKRWGLSTRMELKPLGVILAVIGVVISRLLEFTPGLMIGLLLGIALVGSVSRRDEARTTLTKGGIVFGLAIVAWLIYSLTSGSLANQSFGANLFLETLVAITTEGLTALAIGLLPFKFLEGESLWSYSKPLWVGVWLFVAAVFALVVLPNNLAEVNGSVWVWGLVVAGFAVVAVGLYVYFRFFAPPIEEDESVAEEEQVGSRR